jgi:hypothetical protein
MLEARGLTRRHEAHEDGKTQRQEEARRERANLPSVRRAEPSKPACRPPSAPSCSSCCSSCPSCLRATPGHPTMHAGSSRSHTKTRSTRRRKNSATGGSSARASKPPPVRRAEPSKPACRPPSAPKRSSCCSSCPSCLRATPAIPRCMLEARGLTRRHEAHEDGKTQRQEEARRERANPPPVRRAEPSKPACRPHPPRSVVLVVLRALRVFVRPRPSHDACWKLEVSHEDTKHTKTEKTQRQEEARRERANPPPVRRAEPSKPACRAPSAPSRSSCCSSCPSCLRATPAIPRCMLEARGLTRRHEAHEDGKTQRQEEARRERANPPPVRRAEPSKPACRAPFAPKRSSCCSSCPSCLRATPAIPRCMLEARGLTRRHEAHEDGRTQRQEEGRCLLAEAPSLGSSRAVRARRASHTGIAVLFVVSGTWRRVRLPQRRLQ